MNMREKTYWITTLLVACVMTISGIMAVIHAPAMMVALAHLGYPVYFSDFLGVAKVLGTCVLLVPGSARLKEWAYAGFGITVLAATYSHLFTGGGFMALEPLVTFAALVTSYMTRPADRKFFPSIIAQTEGSSGGLGMAAAQAEKHRI
jgi:hypothetical protein